MTQEPNEFPDDVQEQTPDEIFVAAVVFELALGVLALVLGWTLGPDAREMIPKLDGESIGSAIWGIGLGCAAAIPIYVFIEIVRRIPCEPVRALERLSEENVFKTLLKLNYLELILISICAGVGEELLFRGWLMYFLATVAEGESSAFSLWAALVASSIAFGLVHPITKLYVILAAVMGVYFGVLLIYTENLLVPIAAHAAYDAAQLIMTSRDSNHGPQAD